jgi:hypothetical protein
MLAIGSVTGWDGDLAKELGMQDSMVDFSS